MFDLCTHNGDEQLVSLSDQRPPSGDVPWHDSFGAATEQVHAKELLGLFADRCRYRDEPGNLAPSGTAPFVIQCHPLLPSLGGSLLRHGTGKENNQTGQAAEPTGKHIESEVNGT